MKDAFSKMHPITNSIFFAAVIAFSMFLMHPVCLMLTLICAVLYAVYLSGKKAVLFGLRFLLPTALFLIIINPLLNHRGVTIIEYLPWDNPLTLESIIYGFAAAMVICSAAMWFHSLNRVMTSDKLIFLFGRIAPALGMVLSMALRFIPRFAEQFRQTRLAQKQFSAEKTSLKGRVKSAAAVFSTVISSSMENAIDTSDSMKSRGYGLKGRTSYKRFRFTRDDALAVAVMLADIAALITLLVFGKLKFRYFPSIKGNIWDIYAVLFYILYLILLLTPILISGKEGYKWKRSKSKI